MTFTIYTTGLKIFTKMIAYLMMGALPRFELPLCVVAPGKKINHNREQSNVSETL